MARSDFIFNKADESTGFLLWQVTNLWQREIRKALGPYDLTHSQFVLLASIHWLTLQKRDVTQILLSIHAKIDSMTTSTVLRTMQKKKLIERREHETDTRAKTVGLTETGLKTIKQAIKRVEQFDNQFFASLDEQAEDFNFHCRVGQEATVFAGFHPAERHFPKNSRIFLLQMPR